MGKSMAARPATATRSTIASWPNGRNSSRRATLSPCSLTRVRVFSTLNNVQGLTQRQQMVLDFIRQSIADRGYPPTLREIGARMGIRSTNGVNDHLRALERKGYLTREDMKSRALRPKDLDPPAGIKTDVAPANDANEDIIEIPILGRIAAGLPLLAEEHTVDTV